MSSLFSDKILRGAAATLSPPAANVLDSARDWAARARDEGIDLQNESQLEQDFNRIVLRGVLGYSTQAPGSPGTLGFKQPVPGGTIVDAAIGHFDASKTVIIAPLELKGPKVALDRIMPGRAKTPVQQAWDYAMDVPGARWVLLSNMKELRLYAFGHGRQSYHPFDLKKLDDPAELDRFRLLLEPEHLLGAGTADLLARSAQADRDVTNQLYRDYKDLRGQLSAFITEQHPAIGVEARIRAVQTLLDRLLFIAFAEDKGLLPPCSLAEAIAFTNKYEPRPKWDQVRKLFEWVDVGAPPHNIPRYNGGLFAPDPRIDALVLPDDLVERFSTIADYDFASEVSVTILGHIFEQSITDVENEKAAAGIEAPPPAPKKKREGVVYTPDFITRFIVEQTIGRHLSEIAEALLPTHGRREADGTIRWKNRTSAEADYWAAYLTGLASLRILDPACGSGAFLIAAFNYLNAEQKRVRDRLSELRPGILTHLSADADVEIITNNLFGVDVNAESVEITKLALWLQTARRDRALESLDGNIVHGNSLVNDAAYHPSAFKWDTGFAAIVAGGGFDIVLGNPPYVRMELVKSIKPHLQQRFAVATDRADLYAYFFELGVQLLKPGGRLGFISSSTFFRTGSGRLLRAYLSERTEIETVVDFGDLPVFEGVTTYPAILTLRKGDGADSGELAYLNAKTLPDDLAKTFQQEARRMPRARLTAGTWRFESDMLDAIRAKVASGRPTLAQVHGAPLYGIKTGFNDAFVLAREDRDAIAAQAAQTPGDRSADLLKPFLVGENLKRWRVESDDLWLVYTPKNRIAIDDYPALRDALATHRERLEARATRQEWWELQQAQANYQPHFEQIKLVWPHFQSRGSFSVEQTPRYLNNKCFFFPQADYALAAFLNSRLAWFLLTSVARVKRGGYIEAEAQYVGALPALPSGQEEELARLARAASEDQAALGDLSAAVRHRLGDLHAEASSSPAFGAWRAMRFSDLQALLSKRWKASVPVAERDEWERWFEAKRSEADTLAARISEAEAQIDRCIYQLFDLTQTEIAALEDALTVATPALGLAGYEAISAVEGLELSDEARRRLGARANLAA